ncbi:zinc metalloproteinase nas-13 [Biomphalaria glabrata]|nr:zinc metalloproteinase nas-13 [Biomphalaria glabrata]
MEVNMKYFFLLIGFYIIDESCCMSIDEHIIHGATKAEMLDFFHIMPSGEINIMAEYDLVFSLDQYREIFENEGDDRTKRNANKNPRRLWPNATVYFEILPTLASDKNVSVVAEAIAEWESVTCLRFLPNTTSRHRILFKIGSMCYSSVGMQNYEQPISLSSSCLRKGVVIHEIGHAIGWFHEHTRSDRDQYIAFNVDKRLQVHFQLTKRSETYGIPYDYLSIMHYGGKMWDIVTKDSKYQELIGQRDRLSFKDIKLANLMYQCSELGKCPKTSCPFNGFVLSKSYNGQPSCQCWCESLDVNQPLVLCSSIDKEAPQPIPLSTPSLADLPCHDLRYDCLDMKSRGQCKFQLELMIEFCPLTCGFCGKGKNLCMDYEKSCKVLAASGRCADSGLKEVMTMLCPASCGLCKDMSDPCTIVQDMMGSSRSPETSSAFQYITPLFITFYFVIGKLKLTTL